MTKIPAWRIKELKAEVEVKKGAARSIKHKLDTMELPKWRVKELVAELNVKLQAAATLEEIIEAGVYGA